MASKSKPAHKKAMVSKSAKSAKAASKNSAKGRSQPKSGAKSKALKKASVPARSKAVSQKTKTSPKASTKSSGKNSIPKKQAIKSAPPTKAVKASPQGKTASTRQAQPVTQIQQPPFPIRRGTNNNSSQIHAKPAFIRPSQQENRKPAKLSKDFLNRQKKKLEELRDHLLDQMRGVAQETLKSKDDSAGASAFGMHQADAGSDSYEQDFALSLLSQEQDALNEIQEALQRIEDGSYGVCEMSNEPIPMERLEAIPFARYTVHFQSQIEKENRNRNKWETASPFGETSENESEEEEDVDEEEKLRSKE